MLILVVLFGAGAAGTSLSTTPDFMQAAISGIAFGLVLGLGLWFVIRAAGRRATLRQGKEIAQNLAEATRSVQLLNEYATAEFVAEIKKLRERHIRKRRETDEYYQPLLDTQKKQYDAEMLRLESEFGATGRTTPP